MKLPSAFHTNVGEESEGGVEGGLTPTSWSFAPLSHYAGSQMRILRKP